MAGTVGILHAAIKTANAAYHRLVLLVGPAGTGKSTLLHALAAESGYPTINVNLALSQRMLELTRGQRARKIDGLFEEIISQPAANVIVLDNLEILFDTSLQVDPLRLLQSASRRTTIVASWAGTYQDGTLTYAEPHHPEYRSYRDVDAVIALAGTAAETSS